MDQFLQEPHLLNVLDEPSLFVASGGDGTRDLKATNVTPRTATLSWKPPSRPVIGYRLTYETDGQRKVGWSAFNLEWIL